MRFPVKLTASLSSYIIRKKLGGEKFIPLVLMLEPLFACNLNCSTCGRIREYRQHISEQMALEDCISSVNECGVPIVSVCGGEPLLYRQISELVGRLIDMRKFVYLCTNGLLLADSLDKFEPSERLFFNVHLDGPEEIHDMIVEKDGAYSAVVDGITKAVNMGFQVTVNSTICKQTDMNRLDDMMCHLSSLGVKLFMVSPAYSYDAVESKDCFMGRDDVREKFRGIDNISNKYRLSCTPVYLEYLKGERELECTAWGNPTRNVIGWRSPCYLVADRHFSTYKELIEQTDWESYGTGRDQRCENCMVHCGFEPTAALMINRRNGDLWKMIKWQFIR